MTHLLLLLAGLGYCKQIYFGDLHTHSTLSLDALYGSFRMVGGHGERNISDACDYAAQCSRIDFFSMNDHAESLTPPNWTTLKDEVRSCNDRQDVVAYVGWEWTQTHPTREGHYGHKNVIFPHLLDENLPARAIGAMPVEITEAPGGFLMGALRFFSIMSVFSPVAAFLDKIGALALLRNCDPEVNTRDLPLNCRENAHTPEELNRKLDEWGFESMIIAHGTSWGSYTPREASLLNKLNSRDHRHDRERLVEIYSGHGNSEEWREFPDHQGGEVCPAPTDNYLPCCHRAGEIMRERCDGLSEEECEFRVEEAKRLALEAGLAPQLVFPDTTMSDWLDCDQCRDCFKPAFSMRPTSSVQASLAVTNYEEEEPQRFRWGFISASDNHAAYPGTGFKQMGRKKGMTEAQGPRNWLSRFFIDLIVKGRQKDDQRAQPSKLKTKSIGELIEGERYASHFYLGGLAAVHADSKDRYDIYDALYRRETYATSGPKIELWFDYLGEEGERPMGSQVRSSEAPTFRYRARGAFKQNEGCATEELEEVCGGICDNPSTERYKITRMEVIRIQPQSFGDEPYRIQDPWMSFPCGEEECEGTFSDPGFERDTAYYVRAIQEPTLAINGNPLSPEFDEEGKTVKVTPCYGDYRTDPDDDCLAPVEERAWSSPIYVDRVN